MKNIVDLTKELIKERGKVSIEEIVEVVDIVQPDAKLKALITTDLMVDGRFLKVDDKWDLRENYTMNEVMKEEYKNIGELDLMRDEEEVEEEIELAVINDDIDELEKDDAVSIDDLTGL